MNTPIRQGPVAEYAFEESAGTSDTDTSGNNNNGTFDSGVTRTSSGEHGNALAFDGTGGVSVSDADSLDLTNGLTMEAWVNPTDLSGWRTVITKSLAYFVFASATACNGGVRVGFVDTSSTNKVACYSTPLPTNTWTHIAATYDGANIKIYINGSLVTTQPQTGSIVTNTNLLIIGNSAVNETFIGQIDEVRVYNYARTQTEIQDDM